MLIGTIVVVCKYKVRELNDCRGTIAGWAHAVRWIVNISDGPRLELGNSNLHTVRDGWHEDMKKKLFDKTGIMRHFKGPGSPQPPRHAESTSRYKVPTRQMMLDFWGKDVYNLMETRLTHRLSLPQPKLTNYFWGKDLKTCHAIVFTDGTRYNQANPYRQNEHGYWWSVLAVYYDNSCCTDMVDYCQAQALSHSRPYMTHSSRVVFMPEQGHAGFHAMPPAPPMAPPGQPEQPPSAAMRYETSTTVVIEELEEDQTTASDDAKSNISWEIYGEPLPKIRRRGGNRRLPP